MNIVNVLDRAGVPYVTLDDSGYKNTFGIFQKRALHRPLLKVTRQKIMLTLPFGPGGRRTCWGEELGQ